MRRRKNKVDSGWRSIIVNGELVEYPVDVYPDEYQEVLVEFFDENLDDTRYGLQYISWRDSAEGPISGGTDYITCILNWCELVSKAETLKKATFSEGLQFAGEVVSLVMDTVELLTNDKEE